MTHTIGIAGAGHVGGALALALAEAGRDIVILPPRSGLPERLSHFKTAADARSLAAGTDVVLTCLRNSDETENMLPLLLDGARGKPDFLHVDHCNGNPHKDREFARAWAAQGQAFADAALLGPPERLPAIKPRLIIGGERPVFERLQEISRPYCNDFVHAGPAGNGHLLRLIIGLMGYGIAALSAEVIATANAAGMGPELVRAALSDKGSDSDTFQTVVGAAISKSSETRRLPLSSIRRDLDLLEQILPDTSPQDHMGQALRAFYALADTTEGEPVLASQLTERLYTQPFQRKPRP